MSRSQTTGVYTRINNSFSNPVQGTTIDPNDADSYFDDIDEAMNSFVATSASSVAIGTGSKTFTTQTTKSFLVNSFVQIFSDANHANFMAGTVTSYNTSTGALVINVVSIGGSGTLSDWVIFSAGARGASGPVAGIRQSYSATTTDADPGAGTFRLNNATPSSATAAYLDNVDYDGATVSTIIDKLDDSTSTTRGFLRIENESNTSIWAEFTVTGSVVDGTGYRKLTLSAGSSNGSFTAGDVFRIAFSRAGDAGGVTSVNGQTGALVLWSAPQGRVTLTSGVAITTSDVTGATSVYWQPQGSDIVALWNGTNWVPLSTAALTLALDSDSGHTGYQQSGKNFDLFIADDSGTRRLVTGPAWSTDTGRGSGAGTTEITTLNGAPVNANSMTARFGTSSGNTITVAANRGLLVGTIRMTGNGTTEDSYLKRFLSNVYNAEPRAMRATEATDSWSYSTATIRQANASAANQIAFIQTLVGHRVRARTQAMASHSAGPANILTAVGLDSTTAAAPGSAFGFGYVNVANAIVTAISEYNDFPGLGYHYLAWLEYGPGSGTTTWYGDAGVPLIANSGIWGEVIN